MINKDAISSIILGIGRRKLLFWLSDKRYIDIVFWLRFGKTVDWATPKSFNEKIQWLKIYSKDKELTKIVDKKLVKEYIKEKIGEEYVIPTLFSWNSVEEIDFNLLPDQFVLKCNHDSGGVVICKDKNTLDIEAAKHKLKKSLRQNAFWYGREWPYRNVDKCIIAEQYMEDTSGKGALTDYKLHFFSGECKAIMVGQNRFGPNGLENDFYTPEWKHFDLSRGHSHNAEIHSPKPEQLDSMIILGTILAEDYPFVRVDFYVVEGKIYFGELTFFPASGFNPFHPEKWDEVFGEWIKLPPGEQ